MNRWTLITITLLAFPSLLLSSCQQNLNDNNHQQESRLQKEREFRVSLLRDCLNYFQTRSCEKLRERRRTPFINFNDGSEFDDNISDKYLIVLRDTYAMQCRDGFYTGCKNLPLLLIEEFPDTHTNIIRGVDDYDRLRWRACLLRRADGFDNCSRIISRRGPEEVEKILKADKDAGNHIGLLKRVTDGTVTLNPEEDLTE